MAMKVLSVERDRREPKVSQGKHNSLLCTMNPDVRWLESVTTQIRVAASALINFGFLFAVAHGSRCQYVLES